MNNVHYADTSNYVSTAQHTQSQSKTINLAIANRSRVSCAHEVSRLVLTKLVGRRNDLQRSLKVIGYVALQ